MQNPDHQKSRCPKCHAGKGEPCRTVHGAVAEKVHYGRPEWSARAEEWKPIKLGELDANLIEFTVIIDLLGRDPKRITEEAVDAWGRPTLFVGTDICADCGETYSDPALISRCAKRHQMATT